MSGREGKKPSILAIDVGTSSLKAVLYAQDGELLASSSRRYDLRSEQPGWAEGDPEEWWRAFHGTLSELAAQNQQLNQVHRRSFGGSA